MRKKGRGIRQCLFLSLAFLLSLAPPSIGHISGTAETAAQESTDSQTGVTFRVYASREGLVGYRTANGHIIQENDRFAALPCFCALSSKGGHEFEVKIEYNGRSAIVPVWDVGPWNTDDNYWDPPEQRNWKDLPQGVPAAAAAYFDGYNGGLDGQGREVLSPAGIDIADGTFWHDLGMVESDWVTVTFLWVPAYEADSLPPLPLGYEDVPRVKLGERPPLDPVEPKDSLLYTYFPETGHNVPDPIMEYWSTHGSWRTFGLPLSELFQETQPDGTARLVQYFERAILEFTPPPSDKPIIMADLIGYEAAAPEKAWQPIAPFEDTEDHWYFPETGHSLSNGFKQEWINNGGLPVFGYPITEEFEAVTPDGRRYVTQIFERARFEWWPDKVGTGEEITYGLLVTERLRESGWIP